MQKEIIIEKPAKAGSLESNDILIMISPKEGNTEIRIESIVDKQFKTAIEKTIKSVLDEFSVRNVLIVATDKGALDFTIRARMISAINRGAGA